ncbi:MAG: phosphatase PAP2 family protein [Clostridia bacterium]|nr:phosphatase PAP2 family protein [Clostridia bacterium]
MITYGKKLLACGVVLVIVFGIWTCLIQLIDVRNVGVNGTSIGFARLNMWFHSETGVNITLYKITDWLGLVPVFLCILFALLGIVQMIRRKNLFKVDADIIFLGIYYVLVIAGYLIFEMFPINYRPILIDGFMEVSYPSSTTLLVLTVMPTLNFQINRRVKNKTICEIVCIFTVLFSAFMVIGRLISGVHWLTDIVGSCFFSAGLFYIYKAVVILWNSEKSFSN